MNDESWPRDAKIPEEKHSKYKELTESADSPFYSWEMNELFVYAATYGFDQGLRTELEDASHSLFQWSQLNDAQEWIVKSLAVKEEEGPDVLNDGESIAHLVREYANGGIDRLYEMYVGTGNLFTKLTDDVMELADA